MNLGDCNYEIDHDDDSIPDSGVVYCNIEHIDKFFEKCNRTDNKYVVVSAFSDYGVAIQEEYPVAEDKIINQNVNPAVTAIDLKRGDDNCISISDK